MRTLINQIIWIDNWIFQKEKANKIDSSKATPVHQAP